MTRNYRTATKPGHRICNRCDRELPATPELFLRDAKRPLGLAYECRECHRQRKKGRDRRKERWSNMTEEQRDKARERSLRYNRTNKGRAVVLRRAYERIDACDMTSGEIADMIAQPCVYCGTTEQPRGLDRIDNKLPHIRGNVRPSCAPCNFARGDRFTAEEMDVIAVAVRQVMQARKGHG